ncbi:MAG: DNA topoisomerase IB [Steroidobacteraceae bacterium]
MYSYTHVSEWLWRRDFRFANNPTVMAFKPSSAAATRPGIAAEAAQTAIEAGLLYVSDTEPGIRRRRVGKGFRYLTPENRRLAAAKELKRIASLAIPPAYRDVWISLKERGHLQATGRDARGRKQYRYHPEWRQARDSAKFERMVAFGEALPNLRRILKRDLGLPGLAREKVLAVVVTLLDATRVRIGNTEYARDNKSFGLTTLRNRHVSFIRDGGAILNFRGKGGVQHEIHIGDKRIAQIVRRCQEIPGQHLFQFVSDDGQRGPVDSGQVNEYLRDAMGDDFTAKDFRTWGATLHAIMLLAQTPLPEKPSERALKSEIAGVIKQVAATLRNTPAVCRKSYINPAVFAWWRSGLIQQAFNGRLRLAAPRKAESLVLEFLRVEPPRRGQMPGERRIANPRQHRTIQRSISKA